MPNKALECSKSSSMPRGSEFDLTLLYEWAKCLKEEPGCPHDNPVKDSEKKEHPCFVRYEELPPAQRYKDTIFGAVEG